MREKASFLGLFNSLFCMLALTIFVSGCKEVKKKSAYTIGFSQCIGSDLWRKTMMDEMNMELSLHPGATFLYADADGNSKKQIT